VAGLSGNSSSVTVLERLSQSIHLWALVRKTYSIITSWHCTGLMPRIPPLVKMRPGSRQDPENSPIIDPNEGDYGEHIFAYYKEALRRVYARDAVAWEDEKRLRKNQEPYTLVEYAERLEWHVERIPYKLHRARYHSFFRYFHYLKQLGFIELTGRQEESYIQSLASPDAPSRRYYRLSAKGKKALEWEWYRPQLTLYPEFYRGTVTRSV